MRIITGSAKGRKIKAPEGMDTRPTADRVKEALFNIISGKIYNSTVLDLFAGTGNLGIEAISRGAEKCTFVEHNKKTFDILKENVYDLGFGQSVEYYNQDAFAAVQKISVLNKKYDIVFLDPPYSMGLVEKSIQMIYKLDILNDEAIIVSEYDIKDNIPEKIGSIVKYRQEKYGRTYIALWAKEDKE